ncbi:hypothetical protein SYJ56_07985 [Algoriphagus sp. D3-2-R+10]|uniref:hypothetical protein n=1 Tax=Algoriphagus aurantiacus TaxID=3103948 RepID=UPI002B3EB309|nr:hypothetical protein [Algoriphagus sp. D3-2-R+10]MEB2775244.1 hypothetical protein [Algoriphagus sp. D3-2-R+10]
MEEDKNESSISGIISDAKDFVNERFRNPFLLSFTFFWLLLNWRIPFLVFFSDYPILERYEEIEDFYTGWEFWLRNLMVPLISALLYVFLKDILFGLIEKQTKKPYINRFEIRIQKEIAEMNAMTARIDAEHNLADARTRFKRYVDLEQQIKKLQTDLETKTNEFIILKSDNDLKNIFVKQTLEAINIDFQVDLLDSTVIKFIEEHDDSEILDFGFTIFNLCKSIGTVVRNNFNDEFVLDMQFLINSGYMFARFSDDGVLTDIELYGVGRYIVSRYLYSKILFPPKQFPNFNKVDKSIF